tara:strand:- start:373 stop:762 length:390 start_codon:yes stop_codon:yes gene_type:complete
MALGNSNTSAQSRGKAKPVMVKRRKEVVGARNAGTITATSIIAGAENGSEACGCTPQVCPFNKTYYIKEEDVTGEVGSVIPRTGSKVYTRARINDKFALTQGFYKFRVGETDYLLTVQSNLTVRADVCK